MSNKAKRNHSIQVRLSDEEYEAFNRKFNASGMTLNDDRLSGERKRHSEAFVMTIMELG